MSFNQNSLYNIKTTIPGTRRPLFDLARWKNGLAFKKIDFAETGVPVIKIAELNNGIGSKTSYTKGDYGEEVRLHKDDLLFSWSGNPNTSIDVYKFQLNDGWLNQHIFKLTANEKLVSRDFLYYLLKFLKPNFTQIATNKQTTGLGHVTIADLKQMSVVVPDKKIQNKIVSVVKMIDDKIEANNEINRILQDQARFLFKAWFIDSPDVSKWESGTFSDIIEKMLTGDWGKEKQTGNNTKMVYCIRGTDIPDVKCGNKGKMPIRFIVPKNYQSKHLNSGDVVVEVSGGSPTQSTGRSIAISQSLLDRYNNCMVCSNFCKVMKPKAGYGMFVYYYWQYLYDRNIFFSYENGTTGIKNLDISAIIETEPITLPPKNLINRFDTFSQSVFDVIFVNGLQNELLANTRDSLLPMLMNGVIDVSDLDI